MNGSAVAALLPVIALIGAGFGLARVGLVRQAAVKDMSNLVFLLLLPSLLFRTMAQVHIGELDYRPIGVYFLSAIIVFVTTMLVYGFNTLAAARGLASMFSNAAMIGVPLVGLAFGEQGLVTLFTLISVHALVLLTAATMVFELASSREQHVDEAHNKRSMGRTVWQAVRNSIIHPVPLPILAGLLWSLTGWPLPDVLDTSLKMLGSAMGPMALLLVGITLAYTRIGAYWRPAMRITLVKSLVHPLMFLVCAWILQLRGPAMGVMLICSALPVGANALLFTQRYRVAEDEVVASIALSTLMALVTMPLLLMLLHVFHGT
ncbi:MULTISPECIES: AEC family transporter [Comamonas]|uniref:Transporter n=1 Tax=Comamonas testosteroni TaxID=285 RepID=A0A096FMF6_COMTE|nr:MULTISPECIES: AEC family transporter [Comamonas]KGH31491.1 transporter [Comamonas testosteroni]MDN5504100.1 AEC family transporter [Comamonas sp.]MDN5538428.1 AEC family transporter [Comamonas sp.]MPT12055.1 AEC family transporter [Comamonas sp.]